MQMLSTCCKESTLFSFPDNGREGMIVYALLPWPLCSWGERRWNAHGRGQRGHGLCRLLVGALEEMRQVGGPPRGAAWRSWGRSAGVSLSQTIWGVRISNFLPLILCLCLALLWQG